VVLNSSFVFLSSGTRQIYYISCPYGLVAINIRKNNADSLYFVDTDHLGSILALLRNTGTSPAVEYSYDEWGRRRRPSNWALYDTIPSLGFIDRGYTGHEHYDQFSLIDMLSEEGIVSVGAKSREPGEAGNGRVYDLVVGRFLSPDPVIQSPDFTQNYNGYSYCFNNPLKYTDPSGYSAYNPYYAYIEAQYQGYGGTYSEFSNQNWSYYQDQRSFSYFGGGGGSGGNGGSGTKTYTYTWQARVYPPLEPGNVIWDPSTQSFIIPPVTISPPKYITHSVTFAIDSYTQAGVNGFGISSDVIGGAGVINGLTGFDAAINSTHALKYAQKVNGAVVSAAELNAINQAKALKVLNASKSIGRGLGYAGGIVLAGDVLYNSEIKASHGLNAIMTGIAFTGWGAPISGIWFVADFGVGLFTGKSISDRLDARVGAPLIDWDW
jgi:hypothetical protein